MISSKNLFLLSFVVLQSLASAIEYLPQPNLVWQAQTDLVLNGNGVFISPDDQVTVVTQANGDLTAFDTKSGTQLWKFKPPSNNGLTPSCRGGATFSNDGESDFVIYSVVDDPNGLTPFTRVVSLKLDGTVNWISTPLEGAAAGSPLVSYDGRYVYLTHNSNVNSVGHFTVLDTEDSDADVPVFPLYSEFNMTNPFSPPGIYHQPAEGYYDGGDGNTNDVVLWSFAPNPLDAGVGIGATFVFQLPISYSVSDPVAVGRQADAKSLFWKYLGSRDKDWQSISAPVLTNMGRSLYWSVTKSQFRAWVGSAGVNSARFSRGKTSSPSFQRGVPRYAAVPNSPALSSSESQPMIFAGTASDQFVKMDYTMDAGTALIRNTTSVVRSRAIVSPDDMFVYFTEFSGKLHQAKTEDLIDSWAIDGFAALDGEMSITSDGSMIIVGDVTGSVYAYQVAATPTAGPTVTPTSPPTLSPQAQAAPTGAPLMPTIGVQPPTIAPVSGSPQPTQSPIFNPKPTPKTTSPPTNTLRDVNSGATSHLCLAWIAAATAASMFLI